MEQQQQPWYSGQMLLGIVLLLMGVFFLLDTADILDIGPLWKSWPLVIVAIGAAKFAGADSSRKRIEAAWLAFVGAWLFVSFHHVFGLRFGTSWPLLIIAWGITLLWKAMLKPTDMSLPKEEYRGQ